MARRRSGGGRGRTRRTVLGLGRQRSLPPRGRAREAEPRPGLRLDAVALAAGALATFVVVASGALDRRPPRLAPPRPARPGRSLLSGALLARPSMWLGVSFATSPAGRGRRLPLVAGTAMLGVALGVGALFVVATIESSRTHLESSPRLYGSPTGFVMETNGQEGIPEAIAAVLATDGVDALTERLMINDDELEATGPRGPRQVAPMAYEALKGGAMPPLVSGRFPQGPDEVALGHGTARDLGVQLGDSVHIPSFDGSTSLDLTVTGLVLPGGTQDQSKAFIVSPTTLGTLLCKGGPLDECNLSVDLFANATTTPAGTALLGLGFKAAPVPPSVDRIGQAGALPWYLAGFLCLLGAAGLLHELVTTVRRRRHDLAVARALGLTANRAASAVTWQAVLTALAGALLGLLLGALIGPIVWSRIADDLGVLDATALPPVWLAALLVLAVLAVAYVVALPPSLAGEPPAHGQDPQERMSGRAVRLCGPSRLATYTSKTPSMTRSTPGHHERGRQHPRGPHDGSPAGSRGRCERGRAAVEHDDADGERRADNGKAAVGVGPDREHDEGRAGDGRHGHRHERGLPARKGRLGARSPADQLDDAHHPCHDADGQPQRRVADAEGVDQWSAGQREGQHQQRSEESSGGGDTADRLGGTGRHGAQRARRGSG